MSVDGGADSSGHEVISSTSCGVGDESATTAPPSDTTTMSPDADSSSLSPREALKQLLVIRKEVENGQESNLIQILIHIKCISVY